MAEEEKNTQETQEPDIEVLDPESAPETETTGDSAPPKKEKAKKKKSETEELKAQLETQKDLLLRTAAEFDNFKRRTEREKLATGEYVKANTLKPFLGILDNIQRSAGVDPDSPEYLKGIAMVLKQFQDAMVNAGLTEVAAVGDTFDPAYHEAVMHIEDDSLGENVIAEVLQKGYKIGDTVVRHAMVKVAN